MPRGGARAVQAGLLVATLAVPHVTTPAIAQPAQPKQTLNTLADVSRALRACLRWPALSDGRSGMEFTVRLAFKRDGELLSARIVYKSPNVPDEERALYYRAMLAGLGQCLPLQFSESLGGAIAGRPVSLHIHDTRQQRKA